MDDASSPSDAERERLDAVRREVDRVDEQLLALVGERLRLTDSLAVLKATGPGLPIRPGREITLLRKLIAEAPQPVEPELVVELWRGLIAASLRRQRKVDVVVGGGRNDPTRMFDIARRHFGARTRVQHVGEPQMALQRAAENPENCVAVVPWLAAPGVGAWWPALSERRFHGLHLIAGLPMLGPASEEPEAAVFAVAQPEEGGRDVTLLLAFDPHHRLQRALNEIGFTGKEVSRAEPRVLVRIDGFVAPNDTRAAALTSHGLDGVRVLGSYARI
ncbi:chorismate mutase I [alpha proteobacterium U9-1i]|nr:chorismate mutase I [alpha proteobacterium U9-1i]